MLQNLRRITQKENKMRDLPRQFLSALKAELAGDDGSLKQFVAVISP